MSNKPYWTCKRCGSNLDHGEFCDCEYLTDVDILKNKLSEERDEQHIITCAIEEMSELTKVLTKRLRNSGKFTMEKLEEELGHVYLLCDLIKDKFNISEETIYDHKLDALTRAFL